MHHRHLVDIAPTIALCIGKVGANAVVMKSLDITTHLN